MIRTAYAISTLVLGVFLARSASAEAHRIEITGDKQPIEAWAHANSIQDDQVQMTCGSQKAFRFREDKAIPPGVRQITVTITLTGGGGAGGTSTHWTWGGGGGGSGGQIVTTKTKTYRADDRLLISLGCGGKSAAHDGGATTVQMPDAKLTVLTAHGGLGGRNAVSSEGGRGGGHDNDPEGRKRGGDGGVSGQKSGQDGQDSSKGVRGGLGGTSHPTDPHGDTGAHVGGGGGGGSASLGLAGCGGWWDQNPAAGDAACRYDSGVDATDGLHGSGGGGGRYGSTRSQPGKGGDGSVVIEVSW